MNLGAPTIPIISSMAALSWRYEAWLCDVWGVLHNGVNVFPAAIGACRQFRRKGGSILLISNAPRPFDAVARKLISLGVPDDCYDGLVTSGDVTRSMILRHHNKAIFHLGPERDLPVFAGLNVTLTTADKAAIVVCSGLYDDETETPEDYAALLTGLKDRNLPMVCANPDLMVERGDKLIYCAGALADLYGRMGGQVVYAGKPYGPIYDLAFAQIDELRGAAVSRKKILAIGDGVETDMAGAAAQGIDALFVPSAVHLNGAAFDAASLDKLFAGAAKPIAAQTQLKW